MQPLYSNSDALRSLSGIFTPSNFDRVIRGNDIGVIERKLKKYFIGDSHKTNYRKTIKLLYNKLQNEYCGEYFFKNTLLNRYLLKEYSLKTTTVINEFKIASSVADFVLLNGKAKIYEIKTDLDNLDKLKKQLNDYTQFADLVYVVTTSKFIRRILDDYANSTIGVLEFTSRKSFKEHKEAKSNCKSFNHTTIFKTLRKSEYIEIINDYFGYIPDVPNTKIFGSCLDLVNTIDICEFQKLAFNKLKNRKIKCPDLFKSEQTPYELRQICYSLDFSKDEYGQLYKFLNKSI